MNILLLLPVLLPALAGGGTILLPLRTQRNRNRWTLVTVVSCSVLNAVLMGIRPEECLTLVRLTPEISIALRMDGMGIVFLMLISLLWPLASLYAFEYMEKEQHQPRFFACYTACYGITAGVALSANPVTMYLFVELLTLVTVPLVAHEGDRKAMGAARKYMVYSFSGATMALVGIMMLLIRCGEVSFTMGGIADAAEADPYLIIAWLLTFVGFGVKAAIVPLHAWLPAAGVAPTPVTALLHAVAVVKSGAFAVIRCTYYAFGTVMLAGTWGQKAGLAIAAASILYGSLTAFREQHIKRRLAYSTISNLSYIIFGTALMSTSGLLAAASHMLFHGVIKITLFFCAGAVICKTGRQYMYEMNGLGRRMPKTFAAFAVGALALTGTPLLPGFVSKMNLIHAAAVSECREWAMLGIITLLVSALLTAAYLIIPAVRAWILPEGKQPVFTDRDRDPGWRMMTVLALLCLTMVLLGIGSDRVMDMLGSLIAGGMGGA